MRRREFITLLGGATAWPLAAHAQRPEQVRRIGVLMSYPESDTEYQAYVQAFREELRKLGWIEGRNIRVGVRWGALDAQLRQQFAKEIVASQPDLILGQNTPTTTAILQQTRTIPTVFVNVADPVGSGFVVSFPRPGGNVTGFTNMEPTMAGKWLELLREIARHVNRIAILFNRATAPYADYFLNPLRAAGASLAMEATAASVGDKSALEAAIVTHASSCCRISSRAAIASRSHRWRLTTVSQLSIRFVISLKSAACCPTELTSPISIGARQAMPIASSRVPRRASFPFRPLSSSNW
jgi:putative ABC transport system substrate-binding protein